MRDRHVAAQRRLLAAFLFMGLAACLAFLQAPDSLHAHAQVQRKVFELTLVKGRRTDGGDTVRVSRGDEVELRWSSDRRIVLHLHGYDIETTVTPQSAAVMSFRADVAGRFPVSEHRNSGGHGRALLYVEVHP
jgi:hypothetical protein